MSNPWPELKWWDSGERQVVEEKIDGLNRSGVRTYPDKASLYKALQVTPPEKVRAVLVGQDPYPSPGYATGVAFSIDRGIPTRDFPATLKLILKEYSADTGYGIPDHGDLGRWSDEGVLLWNAIPSVQSGHPLSNDWDEWAYLTTEIIEVLTARGVVFALLGGVARRWEGKIDPVRNRVITTSHPSPRGNSNSRSPFTGSRPFTTINVKLREINQDKIDWELRDVLPDKGDLQGAGLGGGKVLPNITGADLGPVRIPARARWYSPKTLE